MICTYKSDFVHKESDLATNVMNPSGKFNPLNVLTKCKVSMYYKYVKLWKVNSPV